MGFAWTKDNFKWTRGRPDRDKQEILEGLLGLTKGAEVAPTAYPISENEIFDETDPLLDQLRRSPNSLAQRNFSPGLLNSRQAEQLAPLFGNKYLSSLAIPLFQQMTGMGGTKENKKVVEYATGELSDDGTPMMQKYIIDLNDPSNPYALGSPYKRGSGVTVNTGGDKILGKDAVNFRNSKGEQPPPIFTIPQAYAAGYAPRTSDQLKSELSASEAAPAFGDMIKFSFGNKNQKSLFPADNENILSRGASGATSYLSGISESDHRITLYNSNKKAIGSAMARLKGQIGTLTDKDVNQIMDLLPTPGFTPESTARVQFVQIASLLRAKGVSDAQLKELGFPSWAIGEMGEASGLLNSGSQNNTQSTPNIKFKGFKN